MNEYDVHLWNVKGRGYMCGVRSNKQGRWEKGECVRVVVFERNRKEKSAIREAKDTTP